MPGIPVEIAEQMRALWQAAVAVQLDDVVRLKADAQQTIAVADAAVDEREAQLDAGTAERAAAERTHAAALADVQHRYEALSKQLLQETAHQREALKEEHAQFASQLKFAERRVAALDGERERLEGELAGEREARQQAVGEALALKAINASQYAQLDELLRIVSAQEARRTLAAARRTAGTPKSGTAKRKKS
jgi:hypothetical protein